MGLGWNTNGLLNNPLATVLLVDTGQLSASGSIAVLMSASVAAQVTFEYRNAANDTTIWSHTFFVGINNAIYVDRMHFSANNGERFRLKCDLTLVGNIMGSIHVE